MGFGSIHPNKTVVNLNAIGTDTLAESYLAGTAQDMAERKNQVKSKLDGAQREVDQNRDKRMAELKKYVQDLTKGGFLKSFLKIINILTKIISPISTILDSILGKVLKGKLAWLRTVIVFAAEIAQIFITGGASLLSLGAQMIGKTINDAVMRIIKLVISVIQALSQSGIGILDSLKQKALGTDQNKAEKFSLMALRANKNVEQNDDQLNQIKKQFARLLDTTRETINLQEEARDRLTLS